MSSQYKSLGVSDKVKMIKLFESGHPLKALASEFGVAYSTAAGIVRNKDKILHMGVTGVVKRQK